MSISILLITISFKVQSYNFFIMYMSFTIYIIGCFVAPIVFVIATHYEYRTLKKLESNDLIIDTNTIEKKYKPIRRLLVLFGLIVGFVIAIFISPTIVSTEVVKDYNKGIIKPIITNVIKNDTIISDTAYKY